MSIAMIIATVFINEVTKGNYIDRKKHRAKGWSLGLHQILLLKLHYCNFEAEFCLISMSEAIKAPPPICKIRLPYIKLLSYRWNQVQSVDLADLESLCQRRKKKKIWDT